MTNQPSPEKYIQTRARALPIDRCLVNASWEMSGTAYVVVIRKHNNGNFTSGIYLVDLLCLGVKDTFYQFNQFPDDLDEFLDHHDDEMNLIEIAYPLAHNIIYAGHDFACDFQIPQHPDFVQTTRFLLEEDDDTTPLIDVHTGDKDGLPHLVVTPADRQQLALSLLRQHAGEGNFRYTIMEDDVMGEERTDDIFDEDGDTDEDAWDEDDDQDFLLWDEEEWKTFVKEEPPARLFDDDAMISYICLKGITIPCLSNRGMDIAEMAENGVKLVDWDGSAQEETWLHSQEERSELAQLYHQLFDGKNSPADLIKIIDKLRKDAEQFPANPIFRNYLYNAYLLLGDHHAANAEIKETIRLFPEFLMAKTLYADWLMKNGQVAKVPGLFENNFYLSDLYKNRKHFHLSEFKHFNTVWLRYHLLIKDYCLADFYGNLLEFLPDDLLGEQQEDLFGMLMVRRQIEVLNILQKARESSREMDRLAALLANDVPGFSILSNPFGVDQDE